MAITASLLDFILNLLRDDDATADVQRRPGGCP